DICIFCPPIEIQRHAAELLGAWDRATAQLESLISIKRSRIEELTRRLLHESDERNGRFGDLAEVNPRSPRVEPDTLVTFVPMEAISEDGRLVQNEAKPRRDIG